MARFPDFHAFCRAFLCAAAVVLAAENGDAAVSAVPAREVSGAALNEVSALIDSMDYAIRAERDSARREILRGDQRALCAEADDLKRALLARELDLSNGADGGSEAREASPSAAANAGTGRALPVNAAAVAGVTPPYLSKVFKTETGVSFVDYLNGIRVEQAKYLLLSSDSSLKEIAGATGFGDQSYFTRIFRLSTGVSPGKYRKSAGAARG